MPLELRIRVENGTVTITQTAAGSECDGAVQCSGPGTVVTSHQMCAPSQPQRGGGAEDDPGPGGGAEDDPGPGGRKGQTGPRTGRSGTQSCPPPSPRGPFQMEMQQESEWCWAAVSASVERYFQPDSYVTQCDIASKVIDADCCSQPELYDEPEMLQDALDAVGRLRGITGRLTFEQLQSEINANRPVCIRIAWDGGGAHFVALSDCKVTTGSGARTVDVADPFYSESTQDFDLFPQYYHGGGTWTATFLTK